MKKYTLDSFGWPEKKIKALNPKILFNSNILFIPRFLTRKIDYCFDLNNNQIIKSWYIDDTLAQFTVKNIIRFKQFSLSLNFFDKLLKFCNKLFFLRNIKKIELKKNEIILFGPFSHSYAHQLHEFIIRLFYIKYDNKLKKKKIYLNSHLKSILSSEVFSYIFKGLKICYYSGNDILHIKNAHYLTHIENRFVNKTLSKNLIRLRSECQNYFKLNINKISYKNCDFVLASRDKAKKRHLLNEAILFEKLKKYGFKKLFFEDLSFDNQINLSLNMKILVGYHGTAFSNGGLFMNKNTNILEIMHKKYPQDHAKVFSDIQGSKIKRFYCIINNSNLDGVCDENQIEDYIKKII